MSKKKSSATTTPPAEPAAVPTIVYLRPELRTPLIEEATSRDVTIQAVIIERLAGSLGVECEAPKRGRPWPKK